MSQTLLAAATGNWSTLASWLICDAASELDSETGTTNTTSSYQYSAAFTPALGSVRGVAIKVSSKSSDGTVTLGWILSAGSVEVTSVTINMSNVPADGWVFFKFSGDQATDGATAYKIGLKSSTAAVTAYRDGTAANWSRQIRTTTAPGSLTTADKFIVAKSWTAADTGTGFDITYDYTGSTLWGATSYPQSISVCDGCSILGDTTASTNFYLGYKGIIKVWSGGSFLVGTSGTPFPSTSTFKIEMNSASAVDTGIVTVGTGIFKFYGNPIVTPWTLLNTDEAAAQTVIGLTSTSGWTNGDEIVFAPTSTTTTQFEKRTITTVDSSTQVTISSGLTNAHSGTSPTQAEVGNLTRNVKIYGINATTGVGYLNFGAASVTVLSNVQIYNIGSATAGKRGIDVGTTTGSCTITYCGIHDGPADSSGFYMNASNGNNCTFSYNVVYNTTFGIVVKTTTGTTYVLDSNILIGGSIGIYCNDLGGTITNNIMSGFSSTGLALFENGATSTGTFNNNTCHSNANGFSAASSESASSGSILTSVDNLTCWRNSSAGIVQSCPQATFNNYLAFGNLYNVLPLFASSGGYGLTTFNSAIMNGGVGTVSQYGIITNTGHGGTVVLNSCNLGGTTAHSIADILPGVQSWTTIIANNTVLGSSTEVSSQSNMIESSTICSSKHDQTAGLHKIWKRYGTITIDTSIFDVTPSIRMTPNNASGKLTSTGAFNKGFGPFQVANGQTLTVSIKVRESVSGDGTDYNGNPIRLFVKRNNALGITSDTLLATATGASIGAWETLNGTTAAVTDDGALEFYVDCDGTTGWVNIDTINVTGALDARGFQYWKDGFPVNSRDNNAIGPARAIVASIGTY